MIQLLTVPGYDGRLWCLRAATANEGTAKVAEGLWYLAVDGASWSEVWASYLDATGR